MIELKYILMIIEEIKKTKTLLNFSLLAVFASIFIQASFISYYSLTSEISYAIALANTFLICGLGFATNLFFFNFIGTEDKKQKVALMILWTSILSLFFLIKDLKNFNLLDKAAFDHFKEYIYILFISNIVFFIAGIALCSLIIQAKALKNKFLK